VELLSGGPLLLIVNPAARRAARVVAHARRVFTDAGVAFEEAWTERPGHAAEFASARARDVATVVVLGGDGTLKEVAGALAHSGRPVGILPGGTGNLVARALGIPMEATRAARVVLDGVPRAMDLGCLRVGGQPHWFAFSASVGVDVRMLARTPARVKRWFGPLGYAATALGEILDFRTFQARITVDGVPLARDAAEVMIANIGSVLNDVLVLGPHIRADDGRLDLCLYAPSSAAQAIGVLWRMARQRFDAPERLVFRAGRSFSVDCEPPQQVQADGELVGTTPFDVQVDEGAAMFLIPRVSN
jgi:YegS/Rv2252/BmrU family lipid kinase